MIARTWQTCSLVAALLMGFVYTSAAQTVPSNAYGGLRWRLVGPFRGGRVETATGIPGDPLTYYFGSVAGGVWKTTNGGISWAPITDNQTFFSIGEITLDPKNPNTIYVGTGEPCLRNDISYGDGVYKSTDGGKTWQNVGLRDSRHIARIFVDPNNSDTVLVAALGHAFGPNEERGIFRSTDGGKTWQKTLYVDANTGATDLAVDPHDPKTMFAAMYEVRRTAYTMHSGGPGSGLYKSTDGGVTWKKLQGHGLPEGILGRIGVAVSGANSKRVYAMIEAKVNALYSSDDGGESWQMVNGDPVFVRPWYGNHVTADPQNADTVYVQNLNTLRSTDGGHKFTQVPVPHSDDHDLWIDPTNAKRMIESDDGGVSISMDGGATWTPENNQPTGQFYHVTTDREFNYRIYASQQDSGSVAILARSDTGSIGEREWHSVGGGESGYNWPDPRDAQIVYAGDHNGHFTRYDGHTGEVRNIAPWFGARAHAPADLLHRFGWTAPMQISPHNPDVLYLGGEVLFKTMNGGQSWTIISPDLTRNDKSKQQSSPEPLTPDNASSEYYDTIFAIAESPVQKDLIWVGSDDGLVHLTRDGGKSWTKIAVPEMPEWSRVDMIEASPSEAGTAYIAADLHFNDDLRPMIFKTTDFGKTWTRRTNGIPADNYVHSIHLDAERKGLLYAGTENGIYISFDDGANWQSLQLNLPRTPVHDTFVRGNDLVVATHGRGLWVLDNIAPLRQVTAQFASNQPLLYKPAPAVRQRGGGFFGGQGGSRAVGANPPAGAAIDYYLPEAPTSPISLEIADARGQVVHRISSTTRPDAQPDRPQGGGRRGGGGPASLPARSGMNRYYWNYRVEGPTAVPGLSVMEAQGGGPLVPPGTYQVKLTAGGSTQTAALQIKADPRLKVSQADLDKQYQFALTCRDRVSELHDTVNQIRAARAVLNNVRKTSSTPQAIDELQHKMSAIEEQMTQVKSTSRDADLVFPIMLDAQYADLGNVAESSDSVPPQQVFDVFQTYEQRRNRLMAEWKALQPQLAQYQAVAGTKPGGE